MYKSGFEKLSGKINEIPVIAKIISKYMQLPQNTKNTITIVFKLLIVAALLYFFLLSIGLMGSAFKGFGKGFSDNLIASTNNPFIGLLIGILATSLVQSSSTTTATVVTMVGFGTLEIPNAIPIIMGANIGTTVTNTLVSLGHVSRKEEFKRAISAATVHDFFNLICVAILFPLELAFGGLEKGAKILADFFVGTGGIKFKSPIKTITKPVITWIEETLIQVVNNENIAHVLMVILAFIFLFLALYYIVKVMKSLVMNRAEIVLNNAIAKNSYLALFAGLFFTIAVQSSSITTSLMIPMVAAGILTVESVFPITMGANIGTTTTAILASLATGNVNAVVIAFVHFLFNLAGVLFLYPIPIFRKIPIKLAHMLGEIAAYKRRYAFLYVAAVFFIIPGLIVLVPKLISKIF